MTLPAQDRLINGKMVRVRDREWALWCALIDAYPRRLSTAKVIKAIGLDAFDKSEKRAVHSIWLLRSIVGPDAILSRTNHGYVLRSAPL